MKYWMITNRNKLHDDLGITKSKLSYWVSESENITSLTNWQTIRPVVFRSELIRAAEQFPLIRNMEEITQQKHVTLFIHGYNNIWRDAVTRYQSICNKMFNGSSGLGLCVLFTWPSNGSPLGYYPDRADAQASADDLAEILCYLYDWLLKKQVVAVTNADKACRAKTSVIAHSMGNYVLQCAMQACWTRKNRPALVSLINQLLMVAADVDNDLFKSGEKQENTDGDAIANLTYRVTALFTGRDDVLGASAGLKHFGKRRLGRNGLDKNCPCPDNVWDIDCSKLISSSCKNIHSSYFEEDKTIKLMRLILQGLDRKIIMDSHAN